MDKLEDIQGKLITERNYYSKKIVKLDIEFR